LTTPSAPFEKAPGSFQYLNPNTSCDLHYYLAKKLFRNNIGLYLPNETTRCNTANDNEHKHGDNFDLIRVRIRSKLDFDKIVR
jgi:hypothetical protein